MLRRRVIYSGGRSKRLPVFKRKKEERRLRIDKYFAYIQNSGGGKAVENRKNSKNVNCDAVRSHTARKGKRLVNWLHLCRKTRKGILKIIANNRLELG